MQAMATVKVNLHTANIFHTDRGKEFDNHTIDELLDTFDIERSLSRKGNPYDNAVAESTYKSFKFELVYDNRFDTLHDLQVQPIDYVHWWNNFRPHGALNYESPIDYRKTWEEEQSENGRSKSFVYWSATESKQYGARTERVVLPLQSWTQTVTLISLSQPNGGILSVERG